MECQGVKIKTDAGSSSDTCASDGYVSKMDADKEKESAGIQNHAVFCRDKRLCVSCSLLGVGDVSEGVVLGSVLQEAKKFLLFV